MILDSGSRVKKKKKMPNDASRYFGKMRIAAIRMRMITPRLNKTEGSNNVLEMR